MYGLDHEVFLKALTKPRVKVGTEWVSKGQNLEQVQLIFSQSVNYKSMFR
jgi:myosin heavy subunit